MSEKIIIVGGVGGGATVAAQIRRTNKTAEILVLERNGYVSFANCGMPYYLSGTITDRQKLIYPEEKFAQKYDLTVQTHANVTKINRNQKSVVYEKHQTEHSVYYDILILSPGASPVLPDIEGLQQANTFPLRTIEDMDEIEKFIQFNNPQSAAIIGGGFVGLEMVESLHNRGLSCSLIDSSEHVLKRIDKEMAIHIDEHLQEKGITLYVNDGLKSFSDDGTSLLLSSEKTIQADMTIMAIGIKPNTALAIDAGLEIGETGGIKVNQYMQTTDPHIFALGDAVEVTDFITGEPAHIALAWPAHRQAFIISSYLSGNPIYDDGIIGSSILRVFDLTITATGQNKQTLIDNGIEFEETIMKGYSHAAYYPGSKELWMQIVFDKNTGQLFGGSVIGFEGADKRMAVLATAIKGKLTVADLASLELGYSPIYSSAKDPLNILGYKAMEQLGN